MLAFIEQNPLLIPIYLLQIVCGILAPGLWLFWRNSGQKEYSQKSRALFNTWVFTAWGLFFGFNLIYFVIRAFGSSSLGNIVSVILGVGIFGPLAGLALWQAHLQGKQL